MQQVPETNFTSSLSLNQLEYVLHLLLSPVTMQHVSPVQVAFEMIHSLLDSANTVLKPAFFRSSPPSGSESALLSAESYSECICDWM